MNQQTIQSLAGDLRTAVEAKRPLVYDTQDRPRGNVSATKKQIVVTRWFRNPYPVGTNKQNAWTPYTVAYKTTPARARLLLKLIPHRIGEHSTEMLKQVARI